MHHDSNGPGTGLAAVFSLKLSVIIGLIVFWNAGMLCGIHLNDGLGPVEDKNAARVFAGTAIALCVFLMAIASSERVQNLVVADSRRDDFREDPFVFIGATAGVLGVGTVLFELLYKTRVSVA